MLWLVVDALVRRLADTLATEYTQAVELLSTGDIVAEPLGGERAAIVVEGQLGRLFAWTLTPSGRPALVDLDDFVAQLGGLVVVRRLVDLRRRATGAGDSDEEAAVAAAADQFGERMAAVIEETMMDQGRQFEQECDAVGSSGARLVVYSYMRLTLVSSTKPLALFDCEDVLVGGDIDEALDSSHFELTRDAFIVRRAP